MLMCLAHWRLVPRSIQQRVWQTYRRGQCDDQRPSKEWFNAADAAIGYVALVEQKPLTARQRERMIDLGYLQAALLPRPRGHER